MPDDEDYEGEEEEEEEDEDGGQQDEQDTSNRGRSMAEELSSLPTLQSYQAVPSDAAAYGSVNFWDERYMDNPEPFDWYHPYVVLRELIREYVKLTDKVLIAGCGTSRLAEDMYYDGYGSITGMDWSAVVIDVMKDEYEDIPDLKWVKWNATMMDAEDESFDAVIDKGMLDALLCSAQPVHDLRKALGEIERVLSPSGVYLCISVGTPEARLEYLEDDEITSPNFLSWDVAVHAVPKAAMGRFEILDLDDLNNYYYIYTCKKVPDMWDAKLVKQKKKRRKGKQRPPVVVDISEMGVRGVANK